MPSFDNAEEALRFLNMQVGRMDSRLLKVEGENLAFKAVMTMLRATITPEDRAVFAEKAMDLANEVEAETGVYDDNTRILIASYVDTLNSVLAPEPEGTGKPSLSVIPGGKEHPK